MIAALVLTTHIGGTAPGPIKNCSLTITVVGVVSTAITCPQSFSMRSSPMPAMIRSFRDLNRVHHWEIATPD